MQARTRAPKTEIPIVHRDPINKNHNRDCHLLFIALGFWGRKILVLAFFEPYSRLYRENKTFHAVLTPRQPTAPYVIWFFGLALKNDVSQTCHWERQ